MAEHMYSAEEAAKLLGLQVRTVRNYVRDGRLPGVRIGKQYRIARSDLDAFTAGVGWDVRAEGAQGRIEATAPEHVAEVSSVVQIDGIGVAAADRLERTLTATMLAGAGDGSRARVEALYDEARQRLKLIIVGGLGEAAELLRVIELFSLEHD